jgi:hypothetical protein
LNKSIENRKVVLFLWAETGWPKLKTGASFPLSPPMARRLIPTITGDKVAQGVAREATSTKGDRLSVV